MRWQGFAVGALALIALEVVVSSPTGTKAFGGLATGAGKLAQKIISPYVPAFATSASATAANTSSAATSPTQTPPATTQPPPAPGSFYGSPFLTAPPSGVLA